MINESTKTKLNGRLQRIAGQIEGISRMVEQDRSCTDLLPQIASAQAALGQASKLILRAYVEAHVDEMLNCKTLAERKPKLDELMQVFTRHGCLGSGPSQADD